MMKYLSKEVRILLRLIMRNKSIRGFLITINKIGLLPGIVWKRLPVEIEFLVHTPDKRTFHYSSVTYDTIGRHLYWKGWNGFEPETTQVFYELAKDANVVMDIGANTGIYSLLACHANPKNIVIACEPVPYIFDLLRNNIEINDYTNRCSGLNLALSDYTGHASFSVVSHDIHNVPTSSSLHPEGYRGKEGKIIQVQVSTVDEIISRLGYKQLDLVKIDVEGFEDKVLQGMESVIDQYHPTIIVECNPDGPYEWVDKFIKEYGYRIHHLTNFGKIPVEKIEPDPREIHKNFLCV